MKLSNYRLGLIGIVFALFFYLPAMGAEPLPEDVSVTALIYHRFGEDNIPSTNIRLKQFEDHLALIETENITPVSVADLAEFLGRRSPLPDKSTIVTIDDAYRSVLSEAWPRLKKAGVPAILFVATDAIDQGLKGYLTWDEIRTLVAEGIEIGHHGAGHIHMIDEGLRQAREDILRASERFEAELGFVPRFFAYPYGEYNRDLSALIKEMGFTLAFAQYSGAIGRYSDPYSLPRFAINERYGEPSRFGDIIDSRAWPLDRLQPEDTVISETTNPPAITFRAAKPLQGIQRVACYPSHQGEPAILNWSDDGVATIEIKEPFPSGRSRINCTLAAGEGRWFWWGWFFYRPG